MCHTPSLVFNGRCFYALEFKRKTEMVAFRIKYCRSMPNFLHFDPGDMKLFAMKQGSSGFIGPPGRIESV